MIFFPPPPGLITVFTLTNLPGTSKTGFGHVNIFLSLASDQEDEIKNQGKD